MHCARQMDTEGWISIAMIATFKRVAALSNDLLLVQSAVARSTELQVQGDLMRRRIDWQKWVPPNARPHGTPPQLSEAAIALQQAAAATSSRSPPRAQQQNIASAPSHYTQTPQELPQGSAANRSTESQANGRIGRSSDETSSNGVSPLQSGIAAKVPAAVPQGEP